MNPTESPVHGAEQLALDFLRRVWGPSHEPDAIDERGVERAAVESYRAPLQPLRHT